MADDQLQVVELRDGFYRDSFGKVILIICSVCVAIGLLIVVSVYIYMDRPPPVAFRVNAEWRIQGAVPLDEPYLSTPDLLQWVSEVLPKVFVFDFYHYNDQLKDAQQYFTADGWKVFQNQLNIYANYNNVQASKHFINGVPTAAPYIINQGILTGRYAWWVAMPLDINYVNFSRSSSQNLQLQVLVVRVSTLDNLSGVAIDNVIVAKSQTGSG